MKLTILTRFSRPLGFKRMIDSLGTNNLSYTKFVCSYEDEPLLLSLTNPSRYSKLDIVWVKLDKNMTFKKDDYDYSQDGEQYSRLVPNLYFNELFKEVENSWIMMMDDDDKFAPGAIQKILRELDDINTIHIFKMKTAFGIIPYSDGLCEGNIGTPNIIFHSSLLNKNVFWDGYRCGDHRFFKRLVENNNVEIKLHDIITTKIKAKNDE